MKGIAEPPSSNPETTDAYRLLLSRLTETPLKALRPKAPVNLWRKTCTKEIEAEATQRAKQQNVDRKKLAPIREKVARELFVALSKAERDDWSKKAQEEHQSAMEEWKGVTTAAPSMLPTDRQRCEVDRLL